MSDLAQRQQDMDSVERGGRLAFEVMRVMVSSKDANAKKVVQEMAGAVRDAVGFLMLPTLDDTETQGETDANAEQA